MSRFVAEAERRLPPLHVVVARNADDLAHPLRVPDERARALELARPRALRQVARDGDDVEAPVLDQRLHRLVLLGNGGVAEVQVGTVEDRRRHSLAMIASVNWSVVAVPPRSRVTRLPLADRVLERLPDALRRAARR